MIELENSFTHQRLIEAEELLEQFLWNNNYDKEDVSDELADVIIYCIHMVDFLGVNIEEVVNNKMDKNEEKYPVEKAKGLSKKYTEL